MHPSYHYLFGPVQSRRFGRSLGVDLLGARHCSFDCLFCEAGRTVDCTAMRKEYVPTSGVLAELRDWYASGGQTDVVTLAGLGEPTLHIDFGRVIDEIHHLGPFPAVLLSNGSLFSDPDVRRDAARADIVKISLGAWDDASLARLNRPASGLKFETLLAGLATFRETYQGNLRLEVMLVRSVNDSQEAIQRIAVCAERIAADVIELNTVVRPPAESDCHAVDSQTLLQYAALFGPRARVIAPLLPDPRGGGDIPLSEDQWKALFARRACTAPEIALGLGKDVQRIRLQLDALVQQGHLKISTATGYTYYSLNS